MSLVLLSATPCLGRARNIVLESIYLILYTLWVYLLGREGYWDVIRSITSLSDSDPTLWSGVWRVYSHGFFILCSSYLLGIQG